MNYFAEKIGKIGANNIKLVFNINQYDVNDIEIYYPGDRTISYLAIDGYNWGPTQTWGSRWQEFSDIFRGPIIALQEITKEKPVMIGEFSSTEVGGSKSSWIRNAFLTMKELNIESFIWFDINKEQDWRVNSSPASVAAFEESLKDPYFIQGKTLIP
jgi:endoglucanase